MTKDERKRRNDRIREVFARTGSIRQTRRETGNSRKLIRQVLRGEDERRPPVRTQRPSKLDPFKPHLRRLILDDGLTAILAFEELQEMGFVGGYSIVKEFVRTIRPSPAVRPTTVIEHPPGAEGQVDWSPYRVLFGGEPAEVHGFSFVLPFSSHTFLRFALDETYETLERLHDEAFDKLRAVPHRMSYDNMTTVGRHVGPSEVRINQRFARYADKMGFEVHLIAPGKPNEHANVERTFHYVENNCLKRRRSRFDDLDDLNRHAAWWCDNRANVRVHGTTRRRPVDLFRYERSFMKPLPWARPEPYQALARKVGTDFCVAVDTNRYSVSPRHVGKDATVHVFAERIEVVIEGEVHCVHVRHEGRHERLVLPEHEAEYKRCTPSRRLLERAFLRLGPGARDYYEGLYTQRGRGAGYHLKRILSLADRHGSSAVAAAMAHAARYGNYSADAVARVLAGKTLPHGERTTQPSEVPMPPERVRRWLEGLDVESPDLDDYDRMVDRHEGGQDGEEQVSSAQHPRGTPAQP